MLQIFPPLGLTCSHPWCGMKELVEPPLSPPKLSLSSCLAGGLLKNQRHRLSLVSDQWAAKLAVILRELRELSPKAAWCVPTRSGAAGMASLKQKKKNFCVPSPTPHRAGSHICSAAAARLKGSAVLSFTPLSACSSLSCMGFCRTCHLAEYMTDVNCCKKNRGGGKM